MRFPSNAQSSLISRYSSSLVHLRPRNVTISCLPFTNSERFLQRESTVYAKATFSGSREFQASSASRTLLIAVSRVNGGDGGRWVAAWGAADIAFLLFNI